VIESLSLKTEPGSAHTIVRASGEIDMATAPRLRECLAAVVGDVVLDLSDVAFLDSTALSVLIAEHKHRASAGHSFVIAGSSPLALRLFELTGLDYLLNLDGASAAA
jgi:anti-sigma B factor antagonist